MNESNETNYFSPETVIDALPSFVLVTNRNLEVTMLNRSLMENLAESFPGIHSKSDITGHSVFEITSQTPWNQKLIETIGLVNQTGRPAAFEHPHFTSPDRILGWTIQPLSHPIENSISGYIFHGTDITDKRLEQQRLEREAIYDQLTGLYNRNFFENYIQMLSGGHFSLGLINLDADGLKKINDSYGHDAGDEYLRNIAQILKMSFRDTDIVARMGDKGDEFNIIIFSENLTQQAVENRLLILQENIDNHNSTNPRDPVRLSLGYSFIPRNLFNTRDNDYNHSLINRARKTADERMYQHKNLKKEAKKLNFKKPHPKRKNTISPQYPEDFSI